MLTMERAPWRIECWKLQVKFITSVYMNVLTSLCNNSIFTQVYSVNACFILIFPGPTSSIYYIHVLTHLDMNGHLLCCDTTAWYTFSLFHYHPCNFVFIEQHELYFFYICQKSSSWKKIHQQCTWHLYVVLEGFFLVR